MQCYSIKNSLSLWYIKWEKEGKKSNHGDAN